MKLKYTFEAVDMEDEIIFVPVGLNAKQVHGILKLNKEGKEILELLREETTEDNIVNTLSSRYDNGYEQLFEYVHNVIFSLQQAGLLNE